jgi:hypothetical protein
MDNNTELIILVLPPSRLEKLLPCISEEGKDKLLQDVVLMEIKIR